MNFPVRRRRPRLLLPNRRCSQPDQFLDILPIRMKSIASILLFTALIPNCIMADEKSAASEATPKSHVVRVIDGSASAVRVANTPLDVNVTNLPAQPPAPPA